MIHYVSGNIFDSPAQTLVNPVNTVGVMGKGLALEFKKRYPRMFEEYKKKCDSGEFKPGQLMLWKGEDHWILNFPTKTDWRHQSDLGYIEDGMKEFTKKYSDYGITSVAFPKLGCGNGGLLWREVKPLMRDYLRDLPIDVYLYS